MRRVWWAAVFVGVLSLGCSSAPNAVPSLPASQERLLKIGSAYSQFCAKTKQAPTKPADLTPFLGPGPVPDDAFRSADDGQPFVVCWGVDLNKPTPWAKNLPVIAYEVTGRNGRRYVLSAMRTVAHLSDADFRASSFPPGHTVPPPSP